jgi:hypothetical protein
MEILLMKRKVLLAKPQRAFYAFSAFPRGLTEKDMVSLLVSMISVRGGLLKERNWFAHRVDGASKR